VKAMFSRRRMLRGAFISLTVGVPAVKEVEGAEADSNPAPQLTTIMMLHDPSGKLFGFGFQFDVKDVEKVEENRKLAEKLLPDAIAYADARGIPLVNMRAYQKEVGKSYGYTWQKDPTTGTWAELIKKTP
jgi:hypothetical protein